MIAKKKTIRSRVKERFKPIPNARKVYAKLYSVRLWWWALACFAIDTAASVIPLLSGTSPDLKVNLAFSILGALLGVAGIIARMFVQKGVKGNDGG